MLNIEMGYESIWGEVDEVIDHPTLPVALVATAGHGGYLVDRESR